jgi:hypothetical protein
LDKKVATEDNIFAILSVKFNFQGKKLNLVPRSDKKSSQKKRRKNAKWHAIFVCPEYLVGQCKLTKFYIKKMQKYSEVSLLILFQKSGTFLSGNVFQSSSIIE